MSLQDIRNRVHEQQNTSISRTKAFRARAITKIWFMALSKNNLQGYMTTSMNY